MKKLINYFRKRYLQQKYSVVDLTREQLKGITMDFIEDNPIDYNLSENKKQELYGKAALIQKDATKIIDNLINSQGNFAIKEAQTMEQVLFVRGTINGLTLFKEEIERLYSLYKEKVKPDEKFDKHNLI